MNFDLGSNSNRLILLVVSGIALLLALNVYQKSLGRNVAVSLSVVTIVVVGYFAYSLLNEEEEESDVVFNNITVDNANNVANNNAANNHAANNHAVNNHAANNHAANNVPVNNGNNNIVGNVVVNNSPEDVLEELDVVEGFENSNNGGNNQGNNSSQNGGNNNGSNVLNSTSLLPDGDTNFAQVNPSNNGSVLNASLLNAGHHIGVNTQGCSMRNANRGLRSEPPNPQTQVSPWLQTTICPDLYRKPLE